MEIKERYDVMKHVCGRLVAAYDANEYPFNLPGAHSPHEPEYLPTSLELGTKDHVMFLFNLCYWMRGGIESNVAARSLGTLYTDRPDLFNPYTFEYIGSICPVELADLFKKHGLGFGKYRNAAFWVTNSRLLINRWKGDLLNLFRSIENVQDLEYYDAACLHIRNKGNRGLRGGFAGFQKKMVSMIIHFLMDSGFIGLRYFPIPIDYHIIKIAVDVGFVDIDGHDGSFEYHEEPMDTIRRMTYHYARDHRMSSIKLCNVLWLYARLMCARHPAFQSIVGKRNGRKTPIAPPNLTWSKAQIIIALADLWRLHCF